MHAKRPNYLPIRTKATGALSAQSTCSHPLYSGYNQWARSENPAQPQWQSTEPLFNRGDILDTTRYETVKTQIAALARSHGYIDASTKKSSLLVDVDAKMADVCIHLETGERQFGPIQFQQSVYSQSFLRSLAPFHPGDIYDKHHFHL